MTSENIVVVKNKTDEVISAFEMLKKAKRHEGDTDDPQSPYWQARYLVTFPFYSGLCTHFAMALADIFDYDVYFIYAKKRPVKFKHAICMFKGEWIDAKGWRIPSEVLDFHGLENGHYLEKIDPDDYMQTFDAADREAYKLAKKTIKKFMIDYTAALVKTR